MRVEKIDIKKEILDIKREINYMDFIERGEMKPFMLSEGQVPLEIEGSVTRVRYVLQRIHQPYPRQKSGVQPYGEDKYYLVKVDDRDLFEELLEVRNTLVDQLVEKKTDFWKEKLVEELYKQKWKIKKLSWYKRLFNNF